MRTAERFNHSGFSRFLNSNAGRAFRVLAGTGFLLIGYTFRKHPLGVASLLWSALPMSAGAFDVCYISAALGGPLSGSAIREGQRHDELASQPTRRLDRGTDAQVVRSPA